MVLGIGQIEQPIGDVYVLNGALMTALDSEMVSLLDIQGLVRVSVGFKGGLG